MLLCAGCNENNYLTDNNVPGTEGSSETLAGSSAPLVSFSVTAAGETYDAVIDHYAGTANIGIITELETIDAVHYQLVSDKAVIYPEPESFIGRWEMENDIVVTLDGKERVYKIGFTALLNPDEPEDPNAESPWDYDYNPAAKPIDDERLVYENPYTPFSRETIRRGDPHPNPDLAAKGWELYTCNEFTDGRIEQISNGDGTYTSVIQPHGLYPFNTGNSNESAIVRNNVCARVEDGRLVMDARHLDEPVATGMPQQSYNPSGIVEYEHAAFRTYPETNATMGTWFTFRPYMRFEVRFRRTDTIGFNNAIWFQGNTLDHGWPNYGEIDLLENPKDGINQLAHSTIHCGAYNSTKGNAKTNKEPLADMKHWNIYWVELYPNKIVFGVNGYTKQTVNKETVDNDFEHWPWTQPEGFYLLLTTGMHDSKHSSRNGWQGSVRPIDFEDPDNLPTMEFDWIRVYVNEDFWNDGGKAATGFFY